MLVLQLIGGLLAFAAGVVLLARLASGTKREEPTPDSGNARPSSSRRGRRRRSFEDEFADLAEQLRKND